jgi:hypothetical protein
VQLLCAPRKPERFDEAADAMRGCVRRSETRDEGPPNAPADRFLLDTIGELAAAYALADVAVVGRSFGDLHGSDPTEPIGLGCPTILGPAAGDFASIVRAFEDAGGIVRATRESLAATIRALLDDRARAERVAAAGVACIGAHRGASLAHAEVIRGLVLKAGRAAGAGRHRLGGARNRRWCAGLRAVHPQISRRYLMDGAPGDPDESGSEPSGSGRARRQGLRGCPRTRGGPIVSVPGGVAQSVEQWTFNPLVGGSSPSAPIRRTPVRHGVIGPGGPGGRVRFRPEWTPTALVRQGGIDA